MRVALALARRGLGNVWPNPAVGCVLVRDGRIVGRGWTQPGGRPHAETEALKRAGDLARGADAYVTLEPCSHRGETPPCTDALISAGVKRVVIGTIDPDPRVSGSGMEKLSGEGIDIASGVLEAEAKRVNEGFLTREELSRPYFTLKTATTADGKIATHTKDSKWITGADARGFAHLLRATHDAILVGSGTAVADDPQLDCRLPGIFHDRSPRIVIDGRLRLPVTSKLVQSANVQPVWLITLNSHPKDAFQEYSARGVTVIGVNADADGHPDLHTWADELARRRLTRVLVEGGGELAGSLIANDLVDLIAWFKAPKIVGDDGIPAISAFGTQNMKDAARFSPVSSRSFGDDRLDILERTR